MQSSDPESEGSPIRKCRDRRIIFQDSAPDGMSGEGTADGNVSGGDENRGQRDLFSCQSDDNDPFEGL